MFAVRSGGGRCGRPHRARRGQLLEFPPVAGQNSSTRTPSSTTPSPDSVKCPGARTLAECSRFDPDRYTSVKSRRNYAGTSPITIASGRKHAVVARQVRKPASPQRLGPIGGSVP